MQDPLIVIASNTPADIEFCTQVATLMNAKSIKTVRLSEIREILNRFRNAFIFYDFETAQSGSNLSDLSISLTLPLIASRLHSSRIFIISNTPVAELEELSRFTGAANFCVRNYSPFAAEFIATFCMAIASKTERLIDAFAVGGDKYQIVTLTKSTHRRIATEAVCNLLRKRNIHERAVQMMAKIIDELLMNAIFDAPFNDSTMRYRREIPRDADFDLNVKEQIAMGMLFREQFIAISVCDFFGSLNPKKTALISRKNYSESAYPLNPFSQAAGLGLAGIAATNVCCVVHTVPNKLTEGFVVIPYFTSFKQTKSSFQFFSIYSS